MKFLKIRFSHTTFLIIIALSVALYSCHSKKDNKLTPTQVSLVQLLLGDGTAMFRHVSLGIDYKTVTASEKKTPEEKDSNYVFYSMPMDTLYPDSVNETVDTLNYYTVAYNFDQQKLNEIDEDVYLAKDSTASVVFRRLSDYFISKYGDGTSQNDATVWTIKKVNGRKAKVSLSDESEEYDYGKLSLVYYLED